MPGQNKNQQKSQAANLCVRHPSKFALELDKRQECRGGMMEDV